MSIPADARVAPDYVAEFARAAESFASGVARGDPRAAVPTCPGWTVADLVTHLGNVHAWAATIVETGHVAAQHNDEPASRKPGALADWYVGKAGDLLQVLRAADPGAPCWNFAFGEGATAFWLRRQVHETLVHGLDLAGATAGVAEARPAITAALAGDGIDEVLRVFLHRMHTRGHRAALTAPIAIEASDAGRNWTVGPAPAASSRPGAEAVPAPPIVQDGATDAADRVSGSAARLYAMLWKRLPVDDPAVALRGDQARVRAFLASRLTA